MEKAIVEYHLQHLRQLVFEVTDSCNLNCTYCAYSEFYQDYDQRKGETLSLKKAQQIIDYIFSIRDQPLDVYYPLHVGFYGGEPLLNMSLIKEIINYLEYKRYAGNFLTYGMTTNAMLLDKYMDFLNEKKFDLLISLDGNEACHDYRVDHSGKNSFSRVFKNSKLLQEKYPMYFKEHVQFNSVLHNKNNVEIIVHFFKEQFDKVPLIAPLNTSGIRNDKVPEFRAMYQNIHQNIINSQNCENIEVLLFTGSPRIMDMVHYIFRQSGNVFDTYNELFFHSSDTQDCIQTGTCFPFSKKMFVTVHGKILPCERIGQNFTLGQVYDDHVELDLDNVVSAHNYYTSQCINQCKKCFLKNECLQCAYHIDHICDDHPFCLNFCNKERYVQMKDDLMLFVKKYPHYYKKILDEVTLM